jgi:hypothetical protein
MPPTQGLYPVCVLSTLSLHAPISTTHSLCPTHPLTLHEPSAASARRRIGTTLDDSVFFSMINAEPSRACKPSFFPSPLVFDYTQDAYHGYHVLQYQDKLVFAGTLDAGLPDGSGCSIRWLSDGAEYHGEIADGELTGYGRYIFPDGAEFRGIFDHALPVKGFFHPVGNEVRRISNYHSIKSGAPVWELSAAERNNEGMLEMPIAPFIWAKADCVAMVSPGLMMMMMFIGTETLVTQLLATHRHKQRVSKALNPESKPLVGVAAGPHESAPAATGRNGTDGGVRLQAPA